MQSFSETWLCRLLPVFFLSLGSLSGQIQQATFTIEPEVFGENDSITINVTGISPAIWGVEDIYLWAWSFDQNGENPQDAPGNGIWENSGLTHRLEQVSEDHFQISLVPSRFYGREGIGSIGFLVKARNGTGDKKSQDYVIDVGRFGLKLELPSGPLTILDTAGPVSIQATASLPVFFKLYVNDSLTHTTDHPNTVFQYDTSIHRNTYFRLLAVHQEEEKFVDFSILIKPNVRIQPLPDQVRDGLNRNEDHPNELTFVLYAPHQEWVHVIGNFNNWRVHDQYLMHLDTAQDRYWITLPRPENDADILYQYLVNYEVNIADPFSKLILDPHHDVYIDSTLWPDLPDYPGQFTDQAVTWVRQNVEEYPWQITDFIPPDRHQLVVYELLIRDFDLRHSFDAVLDRLDYLQELGINAIELMPVSEFDGNESWGYNPSFHSALDKYYGSPEAFKRLVDECHRRGIAVILDVVFNHATGQNPYFRLWNDCNGCLDGKPTEENPFFNPNPTHSYNVFHDLNHQSPATRDYIRQTIEYWISEFRIDGFRWDLTKGFTQNCVGSSQEACTNAYQADRVEVLKLYADMQWNVNPEFLVIFEHLGVGTSRLEEEEWAQYRLDEGHGIILWNNLNFAYSEATMGYHDGNKSNISAVYGGNRNLPSGSTLSYMESHDEERLMYKMLEYGNGSGPYQIQSQLTALNRLKLAAGFFYTVPGPKMIWQFGELGYDYPINYNGRTGNKPIRWDYADDPERKNVYKTFQALIGLRNSSPVFTSEQTKVNTSLSDEIKRITLEHSHSDATIIGNFGVEEDTGQPKFTKPGTWYDYFTGDSLTIIDTDTAFMLKPGEFYIYTTHKFDTPERDILTKISSPDTDNLSGPTPRLEPNFPNPFDQQTMIVYELPYSSEVTLDIFDLTGRTIKTLVNKWQSAGTHQLTFKPVLLRPGMYFYRLKTNGHTIIKKMIYQ